MRKLFGTDGIRGRANVEPLTPETALRLGQVLARRWCEHDGQSLPRPRIVIGRDTRRSCDLLEGALVAGLCSMGADVLLTGVLPTPGVALLVKQLGAAAGIMISASHNPFDDNGIKLFGGDGFKLPDAEEESVEAALETRLGSVRPTGAAVGVAQPVADAQRRYVASVLPALGSSSLKGRRIVLDCANGAAYQVAPEALRNAGAELVLLGVDPDGDNINAGCGAVYPERVRERVVAERAHLGIALDGDADRLILIDEGGEVVDGDTVLAILAQSLHARNELPGDAVVGTVMSNLGLELALRSFGVGLLRTAVGDRYVVEELRRKNLKLGGEPSGHIVCLDRATTGDGLLAALMIARIMTERGTALSELKRILTPLPQTLLNVRVRERRDLESVAPVRASLDAARATLGDRGRILVRYSGTEPLVRIMVEGQDATEVQSAAREIAAVIDRELGLAR